jgi:hypothetical protein
MTGSPLRFVATMTIVLLSATGFLLLAFTEDLAASGSSLDDLSSSGAFLERDPTVDAYDFERLTYELDEEQIEIPNHGLVPLGDDLVLEVAVGPYPPTTFDLDVELILRTAAGEPITDAVISTVWDMSIMYHGPFNTDFTSLGDGRYAAFFDLFMVGPWELNLTILVPEQGNPQQVTIRVYVWPE